MEEPLTFNGRSVSTSYLNIYIWRLREDICVYTRQLASNARKLRMPLLLLKLFEVCRFYNMVGLYGAAGLGRDWHSMPFLPPCLCLLERWLHTRIFINMPRYPANQGRLYLQTSLFLLAYNYIWPLLLRNKVYNCLL